MSTASIGRKNWQGIKLSGNGVVVAVASRNASSSEKYIAECQSTVPFADVPRAVEGYENLLADDNVDAVYIPLPTGMRKEWVIRAAEAGKHVLCEKPCASSAADLQEMIEACKKNKVQFMDGVMFMHSKRMDKIREAIHGDNGIGKIKRIATQFSFCADGEFESENIRTDSRLEPYGCLGDLGWYTIRKSLWVMDYEMPERVIGRSLTDFRRDKSQDPVTVEFEGELHFAGGTSATFYNSFLTVSQQWAHISGTRGSVSVTDFVLPFCGETARFSVSKQAFQVTNCDFEMHENSSQVEVVESGNSDVNSMETNMLRHFADIVLTGKLDEHWPRIALQTQRLMDACMESSNNGSVPVEIS